ncbi:MAG: carbohydrate ABC transporter permease [Defluviitaleaceae bacterium]|nr:carbohydrate ABC transporter permease [Defluviitaleaceae bacterium]
MSKHKLLDIAKLVIILFLLVIFALLYLQPILFMVSLSFKSLSDIVDPSTRWIPNNPTFMNIEFALGQMRILPMMLPGRGLWDNLVTSTLFVSVLTAIPSALVQLFTCAIAGYAFGRCEFPLKRTLLVLLALTYVVPPQTIFIPLAWLNNQMGFLNNPMAFVAPALFGHGLNGGLFVIIYMQFFRKIPKELEEAALIDGASPYSVFLKIIFPLAKPAMVVVFLFSLVWHWNETFLTGIFYTRIATLATQITQVNILPQELVQTLMPAIMASGLLFITPILIVYLFAQRFFTESIERTGVVE